MQKCSKQMQIILVNAIHPQENTKWRKCKVLEVHAIYLGEMQYFCEKTCQRIKHFVGETQYFARDKQMQRSCKWKVSKIKAKCLGEMLVRENNEERTEFHEKSNGFESK